MVERIASVSPGEVKVRGTRDGIVFQLPEVLDTDALLVQIAAAVERGGEFFRNAGIILDFGERPPVADEVARIEDVLNGYGVTVRHVNAARLEDRAKLREMGKRPLRIVAHSRSERVPQRGERNERRALYIRRTLRSGTSIAAEGDLVVMGDVNPGAEVSATGDVVVWGALRGTVHAGSEGDMSAMICALSLEPTQLRIGHLVARPADDEVFAASEPQRAFVDESGIVVEPWRGLERRER